MMDYLDEILNISEHLLSMKLISQEQLEHFVTAIDLFTIYAWAISIMNKSGISTINGFK